MAYTLCGHEQAANEEHERAMSYYRNALRQDERNYKVIQQTLDHDRH